MPSVDTSYPHSQMWLVAMSEPESAHINQVPRLSSSSK